MLGRKAQIALFRNPKIITFVVGGALVGYFIFGSTTAAIFGGLVGLALSFVR